MAFLETTAAESTQQKMVTIQLTEEVRYNGKKVKRTNCDVFTTLICNLFTCCCYSCNSQFDLLKGLNDNSKQGIEKSIKAIKKGASIKHLEPRDIANLARDNKTLALDFLCKQIENIFAYHLKPIVGFGTVIYESTDTAIFTDPMTDRIFKAMELLFEENNTDALCTLLSVYFRFRKNVEITKTELSYFNRYMENNERVKDTLAQSGWQI